MTARCVLYYPEGGQPEEAAEAALDAQLSLGAVELLGVSGPSRDTVFHRRGDTPYIAPSEIMDRYPDLVLLMGSPSGAAAGSGDLSRIKRLLPGFVLETGRAVSKAVLGGRNMRQWERFSGWGKPIERRPDMAFSDAGPLSFWGVPTSLTAPGRVLCLPGFRMDDYMALRQQGISFISDNCWGGLMYHTLGMEMRSPFINMFVRREHFLRLISDLPRYMEEPLVPLRPRQNTTAASVYPIVMLGDVELHFNHVTHPDELAAYAEKWYRRRDRVSLDRVFVETSFSSREDFDASFGAFSAWPWAKIGFTAFPAEGEGIVYLRQYAEHPNRYKDGFPEYTRALAKNELPGAVPYDFLGTYLTGKIQPPAVTCPAE